MKLLMTLEETSDLILSGKRLLLAGSDELLKQLPKGTWVGGTIPYFMTSSGGIVSHNRIQVTVLRDEVNELKIMTYDEFDIHKIPTNYFSNGFTFIIIPAFSEVHQIFAKDCSSWAGVFNQPLVGWVSGSDLKDQTFASPSVYNGKTLEKSNNKVIVLHAQLHEPYHARTNIINLFTQGQGDSISFLKTGFEFEKCYINKQEVYLKDYLINNSIDLKLPIVADYMGAMINVSFRDIDPNSKKVRFYAPVFPGIEYRLANALDNYEQEFKKALKDHTKEPLFACNCVLNFLYANLEGKKAGSILSAMTFGEVAYMLLNQTMVYLTIEK